MGRVEKWHQATVAYLRPTVPSPPVTIASPKKESSPEDPDIKKAARDLNTFLKSDQGRTGQRLMAVLHEDITLASINDGGGYATDYILSWTGGLYVRSGQVNLRPADRHYDNNPKSRKISTPEMVAAFVNHGRHNADQIVEYISQSLDRMASHILTD